MSTAVTPHVDRTDRDTSARHRAPRDRLDVTEHGGVEPVVIGVRLRIHDASAGDGKRGDDRIDHVTPPTLAEVRDDAEQRTLLHGAEGYAPSPRPV